MNFFRKLYCRLYQKAMYVGMAFMPWRAPQVKDGENCFADAADFISAKGLKKPLIVCDKAALERGALDAFFKSSEGKIAYALYDGVTPNPTVAEVEEGLRTFREEKCDCIMAFGGGSAMDCAKVIGARAVRPSKSVNAMKGQLKVRKKLPPLFAVPTTAGTGSEVTVAAVITDPETRDKYAVNDFCLIPHYAFLDPVLTVGLPPSLTATTGMDALTHAVEAYIGKSNTPKTKRQAEEAVRLIFKYLPRAYADGTDIEARRGMQRAAFLAGRAFTRAYVGYVHALAHALGGKYGVAHGLANSVLLPRVLEKYGSRAQKRLAALAVEVGIDGNDDRERAENFIAAIDKLNQTMNIPRTFGGIIKKEDVKWLSEHADKEANPLYPVPKLMDAEQLAEIYNEVL